MDHHHLLQSELGYQRGMQEVWLEGCLMKKKENEMERNVSG